VYPSSTTIILSATTPIYGLDGVSTVYNIFIVLFPFIYHYSGNIESKTSTLLERFFNGIKPGRSAIENSSTIRPEFPEIVVFVVIGFWYIIPIPNSGKYTTVIFPFVNV
jgi:hypothetical protein